MSSRLAPYGQRLGGWLIDWVIVLVASAPFVALFGGFHQSETFHTANGTVQETSYGYPVHGWATLCSALLILANGTLCCGFRRGQTVGMMATSVRVVDLATGAPIGYGRAFGRALLELVLAAVFFVPWVIDMLFPLWDPKNQTLHDKVVRSVVIHRYADWPPPGL